MGLKIGARLGPYEITGPLGAGGMGEVYRATDTKLRRDVAIKVLPEEVSRDRDRLARFEREAHVLASLNHPNIASIYGLEESDGVPCLVLELVEGQTLAEKLNEGELPVEKALELARQIALALEAAHEKGIIHRDLKPANIKVTPEGAVKVLDFGLAKILEPLIAPDEASRLATTPAEVSRERIIAGTPAYMSPEQLRGDPLDFKTDVWSFGCVLYEMLSGRSPFRAGSVSEVTAAILEREPDWAVLPEGTAGGVRRALRRCLQKDAKRRLHAIADVRIELEDESEGVESGIVPADPEISRTGRWKTAGVVGLVGGTLLGVLVALLLVPGREPPSAGSPPPLRASIVLPDEAPIILWGSEHSMSLSPDGRRLVYVSHRGERSILALRNLSDGRQRTLPGTEGAHTPFFSPDGEWIGFFSGTELRKVAVSGGDPTAIVDVKPTGVGGSWDESGRIVVAPSWYESLARVSVDGGGIDEFLALQPERGEKGHLWPQVLPGGEAVLFTVRVGHDALDVEESAIAIEFLETRERQEVVRPAHFARYVETGHLLFQRGRTLLAAPFDLERAEITGRAVPIADDVFLNSKDRVPQFTVSRDGLLVYAGAELREVESRPMLVWWHENGGPEELPLPAGSCEGPRLSPDGERVACTAAQGNEVDVWIYELDREVMTLVTPGPGRDFDPIWSPEGDRLAFTRSSGEVTQMYQVPADGSRPAEPLRVSSTNDFPTSWTSRGSTIAFTVAGQQVQRDIWTMEVDDPNSARPWLESPFNEEGAEFSPDGRWIAYVSDESGVKEVYVRPYPGPGSRTKISVSGGWGPAWPAGHGRLYYMEQRGLMAVTIEIAGELRAGTPQLVLEGNFVDWARKRASGRAYDVPIEAGRYLMMVGSTADPPRNTRLRVLTGWADGAPD